MHYLLLKSGQFFEIMKKKKKFSGAQWCNFQKKVIYI